MDEALWLGGSQTRVCDTGPQVTPLSLFRCGPQRYSAVRTTGYVRTRRPRLSELADSDPETQRQQMLAVGVALSHIYQDVGIYGTSGTNSRRAWRPSEGSCPSPSKALTRTTIAYASTILSPSTAPGGASSSPVPGRTARTTRPGLSKRTGPWSATSPGMTTTPARWPDKLWPTCMERCDGM